MKKLRLLICICFILTLLAPAEVYAVRPQNVPCRIYYGDGEAEAFDCRLEYALNLRPGIYSPRLAHMLGALSCSAYNSANISKSYSSLGFADRQSFNYYPDYRDANYYSNSCAFTIGRKKIKGGTQLILITIRGTYGSSEEETPSDGSDETASSSVLGSDWTSNLNTGWTADSSGFHAGFNIAAAEVLTKLEDYLGSLPREDVKYVITGHSRGAAIANLLSYRIMEKGVPAEYLYDYNFACPNNVYNGDDENTIDLSGYNNIFNISSCRDIIAQLPGLSAELMEYFHINNIASAVSGGRSDFGKGWNKFGRTLYYCSDWDNTDELGLDFSFESHHPLHYLEYLREKKNISSLRSWEDIKQDVLSNTSLSGLLEFNSEYLPG